MKRILISARPTLAFALLALLTGCQSFYLIEQGFKNRGVMGEAVEIETSPTGEIHVEGTDLDDDKQGKLRLIAEIREFAASELGLDVGDAYTTYYQVPDGAISHVVVAAHPLALAPYEWRFPIVGRVTYKGFFDREDAEAERDRLRDEGWDTHMGPVAAFSSLGWFDDPVLSTMLEYTDGDLADVIIHELAHRTVYFQNATDVNESMASVIGKRGAQLFLVTRYGEHSEQLDEFDALCASRATYREILRRLRFDLDALYRSNLADEQKLSRKEELFANASRLLYPDAENPESAIAPSNAFIIARKQYSDHVALFREVLAIFGGEPTRMMAFLKSLPESEDPLPALRDLASKNRSQTVSSTHGIRRDDPDLY